MHAHLASPGIPSSRGRAVPLGRGKGRGAGMHRPKGHSKCIPGEGPELRVDRRPAFEPGERRKEGPAQWCPENCQGSDVHTGSCITHFLIAAPKYLTKAAFKKGLILFMIPG